MNFFTVIFFHFLLIAIYGAPTEEFASGNKLFTAAVYKEIAITSHKNILVSPFAAEIILALAQSGAKGETGQEIRTSLHLPNTKEDTEEAVKTLLSALKGDENYSLHTANKIYVTEGTSVKEKFKEIATTVYQSDVENINFVQKEQAANTMNKWVEKNTNEKIHDLFAANDIDSATTVVLVNALYFKGDWQQPFSNRLTQKQKFYKTSQDIVEVDMMQCAKPRRYNYYEDSELDATFLELPFKGQNISMIIVLPNQRDGISTLENYIDKVFAELPFRSEDVYVTLPKFSFETTIDLKPILINLGVEKAFDSRKADFSEIAGVKGFLVVDDVRQKSFIDVNEIGVEAAAATFMEMVLFSAPPRHPKRFIADHPFIFYIKFGSSILFAGRVSVPTH